MNAVGFALVVAGVVVGWEAIKGLQAWRAPAASASGGATGGSPGAAGASSGSGSQLQPSANLAQYVNQLRPYAEQVQGQTGIPADVLLSIGATEGGQNPAGNSLFGVSCASPPNCGPTVLYANNGGPQMQTYTSVQDAVNGWVSLIEGPRYRGCVGRQGTAFINCLGDAGYVQADERGQWEQLQAGMLRQVDAILRARG